jgi:type IV pilus assembly protein PilC
MTKHHYVWRGIDRKGQSVRGTFEAHSSEEVRFFLRQQRIRAKSISKQLHIPSWLRIRHSKKVSVRDVTQLTRQLATLLHAGVPLLQALDILERGESNTALAQTLRSLRTQIEGGAALNLALRQHSEFDALYCNLVAVGELTGMLDTMLLRLAIHLEKSNALHANIRSALVYPVAVLSIAVGVLVLILWFVVPAFQNIFSSFGAELPWLTQAVISMSQALQDHGIGLFLFLLVASIGFKRMLATHPTWQYTLHKRLLQLPVAGPLTRHACTARWSRTLATLFAAGIPLTEALDAAQGVTGHLLFQNATREIQARLIQGERLSHALDSSQGLFPQMLIQMCAIGEEAGALEQMLEKTAEHYEQEVEHTVARLSTLLEPFIMVVLGVLIGGLVMALYLPIFQLGQVV